MDLDIIADSVRKLYCVKVPFHGLPTVTAKPVARFLSISWSMEQDYSVLRWRPGRAKFVAVDFRSPVAMY